MRQRNTELEAEKAKLEEVWSARFENIIEKNDELRKNADLFTENFDLKREVANLRKEHKSSVEKQERKNTELESRLTIMEQGSSVVDGQPQNDSHFEEAVVIPESVSIQLNKQHMSVCEAVSKKPANEIVPEVSKSSEEIISWMRCIRKVLVMG